MTTIIITKYMHYLSLFVMVGALFAQQAFISKSMIRSEVQRFARIGNIYLIGMAATLIAGLVLWFWVGKPTLFYAKNWIFHMKLSTFFLLIVVSAVSAIFFNKRKKGNNLDAEIIIPGYIIALVRLEFLIVLFIPLLASFVTVGIGAF